MNRVQVAKEQSPVAERDPQDRGLEAITILLDAAVVSRYKALGPDWKSRIQEVLRSSVQAGAPGS